MKILRAWLNYWLFNIFAMLEGVATDLVIVSCYRQPVSLSWFRLDPNS